MKANLRVLAVTLAAVLLLCGVPMLAADTAVEISAGQSGDAELAAPARLSQAGPIVFRCSTAAELRGRLEADAGGVMELADNIAWADYGTPIAVTRPVTVQLGQYGIQIAEEAAMYLSGPVRFEGMGNPKPLFEVNGYLFTGPGVEIAAVGKDAVALELNRSWESEYATVSVRGDGATGVIANSEEIDLASTRIEARGANAVGIRAEGGVRLLACAVLADGGAVVSETGDIQLDASRASPFPAEARVIHRRAVPRNRIQQNGVSVPLGASADQALAEAGFSGFELADVEGIGFWSSIPAGAVWQDLPESTTIPGSYTVTCVPTGIPDWLPVEGIGSFPVPFHVVDEN